MGRRHGLLAEGEHSIMLLRTHGKALFRPVAVLLVLAAVTGLAVAVMPASLAPVGWYVLAGLVALGVLAWVVVPFARWRSTTYLLTSRRLVSRTGIISRRGHDVPLARVVDVRYRRSLGDRLLGCGTLLLHTASDTEPLVLPDVPDVARVHRAVVELAFGGDDEPQVRDETGERPGLDETREQRR